MWTEANDKLTQTFKFDTFEDAMAFMQQASVEISKLNHHPEWKNIYNEVSVTLRTHDAGDKVTEKDRKLAAILDDIYCQML